MRRVSEPSVGVSSRWVVTTDMPDLTDVGIEGPMRDVGYIKVTMIYD